MNECESQSQSDELYFLPGSLAEIFNKDNKIRQYFDDSIVLKQKIGLH